MTEAGQGQAHTKALFNLSVRTYEEAAQVLELNGLRLQDCTENGAGGGGIAGGGGLAAFRAREATAKVVAGKTLTTDEVPLSKQPIKRAAMSHMCYLCSQEVVQGDEIWPVPKAEGEGVNPGGKKVAAYAWAHLECARSHAPDGELFTPVCPHWQKRGTCSFGALCFYDHPEALAKNQAGRATADASVPRRVGTWKRRVTRKSGKASIFRRWLIDHFGLELLSSGSGVLDVAGGKGEVAFELVNLNRIPTTVVDPRPLDLSSYKRKFEYGIYWRNPLMHIYIHPESSCETPVAAPKHLRVFFDDECLEAFSQASRRERMSDADQGLGGCELYDGKCWDGFFPSAVDRGHEVVWTKKGLIALDDLTEENSYPTRKRGGKEARVGGMEGQEKEGEGSEQADEAERPRGGDKVDGGWKKRSKDAGVPKHLRRERVRGVRPELRASRTERVGDEAGMDWALDAFASLTEVVGSSEEAVQEASAEEGEGEAGGEDGENAQGPEASGEVVTETDGEEVVDSSEALAVLDRSSVVIGLHPDQAVGSLVDFALAHNKPFACVPCCVYWKSFPRRRLPDGSQVRTYEQLIDWLKAKHPDIQEATIDFEGKNRLLWWRPCAA